MAQEQFSKCNFVNTEINHDLNPPISVNRNRSEPFIALSRSYLDAQDGQSGCNNFLQGFNFKNDSEIVQLVFGATIEQLRNPQVQGQEIPIQVLSKTENNSNIVSSKVQASIHKYNKPYNQTLFNLFPELDHVFFIVDTGDNLIQTLKGLTYNNGAPPNIHVIHSALTLADSAPKTLPDSKNYNSQNPTVRLFSWYLPEPIEIPRNDRLFMSAFRINNLKFNAPGWKMRQDWFDGNNLLYQTFDAKKENSKPLVKTYLSSNLEGILGNMNNNDNKRAGSLNMQKKSSGDYFQIWIAEMFPQYAAAAINNIVFVRGPQNIQLPQADQPWYKNRTYFVTGDWPAFCYAAYNKINAIMIFKHPTDPAQSCTIRVKFQ